MIKDNLEKGSGVWVLDVGRMAWNLLGRLFLDHDHVRSQPQQVEGDEVDAFWQVPPKALQKALEVLPGLDVMITINNLLRHGVVPFGCTTLEPLSPK